MVVVKTKLAVAVIIVDAMGMVLAVSRKDDPNAWSLPGGKFEADDVLLSRTALRELEEETGLHADRVERVHSAVDDVGWFTSTYRVRLNDVSGDLRKEVDGGDVAWVHPSKLLSGPFPEYMRSLYEAVGITIASSAS